MWNMNEYVYTKLTKVYCNKPQNILLSEQTTHTRETFTSQLYTQVLLWSYAVLINFVCSITFLIMFIVI